MTKHNLSDMHVDYEQFRKLAKERGSSMYEKIGFPDNYREGYEEYIFGDILTKLTNLDKEKQSVLDIGPGCSDIPKMFIEKSKIKGHKLVFCDSPEMLELTEEYPHKVAGMFPKTYDDVRSISEQFDVIVCYSVFHYIYIDTNVWDFVDKCMSLLAPGGQFLIGDIPNVSKRKRFFSSQTGVEFHKEFMKTNDAPIVEFNVVEHGKIDDSVILSTMLRAQNAGFDAYLLPQNPKLPMSNRRDDILIVRP